MSNVGGVKVDGIRVWLLTVGWSTDYFFSTIYW